MKIKNRFFLPWAILRLGFIFGCLAALPAEARLWTDHAGRQVEAEFKEFDPPHVILEGAETGARITLPLRNLSEADQALLFRQHGISTTSNQVVLVGSNGNSVVASGASYTGPASRSSTGPSIVAQVEAFFDSLKIFGISGVMVFMILLTYLLAACLASGLILHLSAKMLGCERGFWFAVMANLAVGILAVLTDLLFSVPAEFFSEPGKGWTVLSGVLSFLITTHAMGVLFRCGFFKGLLLWLLTVAFGVASFFLLIFGVGGLAAWLGG